MSLLITNKNTLKDVAIIVIKEKSGERSIQKEGDFAKIYVDNELVGVNVFNFEQHFAAKEGAHTINAEQMEVLKANGISFEPFKMFTYGKVISRETHPKSDRLFVLKVQTEKELQIVTNSLNSTVGETVVVARVGAVLPSGMPIVFSKVMGVESEGMLCGGETLGLEKTDGVLLTNGTPGEEYIL